MTLDKQFSKQILENINNLKILESKKLYEYLIEFENLGLTKYKKRNVNNWNYWWYEVDATQERPNKNNFTADLTAFELTFKGYKFLQFLNKDENKFKTFSDIYFLVEDFMENSGREYYTELVSFKTNPKLVINKTTEQLLLF